MTRRQSIEALLEEADNQLSEIRQLYLASAQARQVDPVVAIRVKNFLENLRSVLDYLAQEIRETCCGGRGPKTFYFPIFQKKRDFDNKVDKWYPQLGVRCPEVRQYLYDVQPLPHRGSSWRWLWHFNRLTNSGKHDNLVIHTTRYAPPGAADRLGPVAIRDESGRWTEIRFKIPRKNAVMLLWQALIGIEEIELDLGALLVQYR